MIGYHESEEYEDFYSLSQWVKHEGGCSHITKDDDF